MGLYIDFSQHLYNNNVKGILISNATITRSKCLFKNKKHHPSNEDIAKINLQEVVLVQGEVAL